MKKLTLGAGLGLVWLTLPVAGQITTLVSVGLGGTQGDQGSFSPALSATGRYVAFHSAASNLVPGDSNGYTDVFWRDRRTGVTLRVSVDSAGNENHGGSYSPVISADGRYVAFYSMASQLVPEDTNGFEDVFLHDVLSGTTELISHGSNGALADGPSYYASLSADGRFVAFDSFATNLVPGDTNGHSDVFLRDRATGVTTRVSVDSAGLQADDRSAYPSISADGSRIVFESKASNLTTNDANGVSDIFVRDQVGKTTICVSVDPNGVPGDNGCSYPCISPNGRVVAFGSGSSNLVAGDTNGLFDVFTRDLSTGRTRLESLAIGGAPADGLSQVHTLAAMSFDGRYLTFKSAASNLVPGDSNAFQDIFLRDRELGTTARMNVGPGEQEAQGPSSQPSISANGRFVAFYSFAGNLVLDDANHAPDAFVRSLP